MVVHLADIDHGYDGKEDVEQVWAQAKALYDQGETWQLAGSEADLAEQANEEYQIEDPLTSYVLQRFTITGDLADRVETARILKELHIDGWRLHTPKAESMAIASLFKTQEQFQDVQPYRTKHDRGYEGLIVKDRIANP